MKQILAARLKFQRPHPGSKDALGKYILGISSGAPIIRCYLIPWPQELDSSYQNSKSFFWASEPWNPFRFCECSRVVRMSTELSSRIAMLTG
jgi:hypothetical protein